MGQACCKPSELSEEEKKERDIPFYKEDGRKLQDVFCLALWVVCWAVMIGLSIWAFMNGNPTKLIYGTDYAGKVCGGSDRSGSKYMAYPRMNEDMLNAVTKLGKSSTADLLDNLDQIQFYGVCVSACPLVGEAVCNEDGKAALKRMGLVVPASADGLITTTATVAKIQEVKGNYFASRLDDDKRSIYDGCWGTFLDTKSLFYRCMPIYNRTVTTVEKCTDKTSGAEITLPATGDATYRSEVERCEGSKTVIQTTTTEEPAEENLLAEKLNQASGYWSRWMGDMANSWHVILVTGFVFAIVFGFAFTFILKYLAGCVVWSIVALLNIMCLVVSFLCYVKAGLIPSSYMATITEVAADQAVPASYTSVSADGQQYFKWGAGIMSVLTVLVVVTTVAMIKRIRVAIGVIRASTSVLKELPFLALWPFFTVFFVAVVMVVWLVVSAFISTMTVSSDVSGNSSLGFNISLAPTEISLGGNNVTIDWTVLETSNVSTYLNLFNFFMFLWTNQIVQGVGIMTIAGAVAELYWRREDGAEPRFPVLAAYGRTMRYNLGTVCFGGFLIAVVQFIRACLAYVQQKLKESNQDTKIVKAIMCVMQSYMWCLEKCMKFISRNAYIWSAMYGHSFCSSAMSSFLIILSNVTYVAILNGLSFFVTMFGKLSVTALCTFTAFVWLEFDKNFHSGGSRELSSIWLPLLISAFVAYFASSCFFYVYDMVIDTIMICFLRDMELVDGGRLDELKMNKLNPALSSIVNVGTKKEKGEGAEAESKPAAAV